MSSIHSLLQALPKVSQSRVIGSGFGVWLAWKGNLNTAASNTLQDFGCIPLVRESGQALWFSSTNDVFRVLARLHIWSRLNAMPLIAQVFPVTFQVGYDLVPSLSVPAEFSRQRVDVPNNFEAWIHPKCQENVKRIAGLSVLDRGAPTGMATLKWGLFQAEDGLDYETTLSWYFALKPLGRMGDKEAIVNWRAFFAEIQVILQRMKLRYITGAREEVVLFALDSPRVLRQFCSDILNLVAQVKADPERQYWPCVMAAMPQKNRSFSEDLPQKFNLDWNRLTPDFPHLQYRDAFMLSETFRLNDVRYGGGEESMESWCNLSLLSEDGQDAQGTIDVAPPRAMLLGDQPECFYCGLKNHEPGACPSRKLGKVRFKIWGNLAQMNTEDMNKGFATLDGLLGGEDPAGAMGSLLQDEGGKPEALVVQALYEINVPAQLRMLRLVWRSRGKEWPAGLYQLVPEEGQFVWEGLEALKNREYEEAENLIKQARVKYARSFIPSSLQAIWFLETGDLRQAHFYLEESERLSLTPLQQGYFLYLQGRIVEIEGDYREAAQIYKRALATSPEWIDPAYRGGVCMVKMGFTGQAIDIFFDIIDKDPHVFNRILVDPEVERGRAQVLSALWSKWSASKAVFDEKKTQVAKFLGEIDQRFETDHPFHDPARVELEKLSKLTDSDNYVSFRKLIDGLVRFEERLDKEVDKEVKRIHSRAEHLRDRIIQIQRESAWFPFPKLLKEFNQDFNYCVEKINWINSQHLKSADTFRQSIRFIDEIETRITSLQGRLVTLRIIRDSTLFVLMLGRTFIWLELVGLGLSLVVLPLAVYFTRGMEGLWIIDMIREQQWDFQKGLILILSVTALVLALLKTTFRFDKRKKELFEKKEQELLELARERRKRARRMDARRLPRPKKKP